MGLFNIGLQADDSGNLNPTQDFGGMLGAASSQINSLTRGVSPGQFSSLGKPLGTMYKQNPGFFRSGPGGTAGFGDAVSQRNQTFAEQFKIPDYSGGQQTGSPAVTAGGGDAVSQRNQTFADQFKIPDYSGGQQTGSPAVTAGGGIPNPMRPGYAGPYRPGFTGTTEQQKSQIREALQSQQRVQNRAALQEQVDAKRMLGQATGDIPTMQGIGLKGESISTDAAPKIGEARNISGKYGTGFATFEKPGTKKEGLINGRPASEVLQGLANKPGIARAGDRFQPQKSTPAESKEMNKALSKLPMKNPLLKK